MKKRILSGAQPTGSLHLGNYLGALKNWVGLQHDYESFYCIVNLHAITLPQDPAVLRQKTLDLARIYLASGIDPQVSTIFIQSDVHEHAELTWILSCVARMGELERMTQFKDKSKGSGERAGVGLFTYPILMAADILLYQAHLVPVGQDQKQHLELSRDLASVSTAISARRSSSPTRSSRRSAPASSRSRDPSKKMSKSDDNANGSIFLLDEPDAIVKKIKRAVTDSGTAVEFDESRPAITNLLTIYQLMTGKTPDECVAHFEGKGYGQFKGELAEAVVEFLKPFQDRVKKYDDASLNAILKRGAEKAREVASKTLKDVYEKMGIAGAG